ncbi:hypothetical protein I302_101695 [Kwoniella bestiolae CBS 10118]|uniref:Uncharacterized protein n=1 Tax=Kwoniella bestiolae CBS 10118 TaxID=1296100 RepID=A0A1B9GCZ1_9TREE|nr:hypothetical protein I302_00371 [Kwoniella bestiolae CBS 10118]OCF28881.1 hypothetical protein I302_00371 [Kwoniella bestiolae CBS 10118]
MTTSTPQRYPSSLSQAKPKPSSSNSGPSRTRPPRGYPPPSIDSSIGSPPSSSSSSVPLNEYSSLADLLHQAGYKETRVFTPKAEKLQSRRKGIKKTFNEQDEDEINNLYGTYGFTRPSTEVGMERSQSEEERMIRHQHITEHGLPMKSSSSILRSLAIQDQISNSLPKVQGQGQGQQTPTAENSWWNGWGVVQPKMTSTDSSASSPGESSVDVGLGLAKNGEGVKRVKPSQPRRAGTESPPQEQKPPYIPDGRQRVISSPTDLMGYTTVTSTSRVNDVFTSSPPPPPMVDEDEYGYSPLPEDYEEQCTEDEVLYSMGLNDYTSVYSLGSSNSNATSLRDNSSILSSDSFMEANETSSTIREDRAVREINDFQYHHHNEAGRRILDNAVDVDQYLEFDSPDSGTIELPQDEEVPSGMGMGMGMDNGVPRIPLPTTPQSSTWVEEQQVQGVETKKPLKYGDRATKLRIAHSTPALRQSALSTSSAVPLPEGWLGSIKSALLGKSSEPLPPISTSPNGISQPKGPIKISTAKPALPTLITTSPVICDSHSNEAVDLPPVPTTSVARPKMIHHATSISNIASSLMSRPSLAKLRSAVLGQAEKEKGKEEDNDNLVLSPRLNWDEQGKQFAGWSPYKSRSDTTQGINGLFGPQTEDIDYSKSFFYKPITPPKSTPSTTVTPSTPPTNTSKELGKKRSIKSLKAALLLPVAPSQPPVPPIPEHLSHLATPRKFRENAGPPILAIQSPGAWAPRELVLEGEEWDAREGDWGAGRGRGRATGKAGGGGKVRRRKSRKVVRD